MNRFKLTATMCCLTAAGALFAPHAQADEWNRKTVVTFSGPVEIPGVHLAGWGVLPAGTYVFKIMDSQTNRHIVQIFNKDETTLYATILAIPNYRLQATDKTVITFSERPAGQPEALRAWFYPGRNFGEEFVYPKEKAVVLAKASSLPVLFTPEQLPVEVAEPAKLVAPPLVTGFKRVPVMAVQPDGQEVQLAAAATPPPADAMRTADAAQPATETLPSTASNMPLVGFAGVLALICAFALPHLSAPSRARRK